jgi:hypothetical protein
MRRRRLITVLLSSSLSLCAAAVGAQQSDLSISPFVSLPTSAFSSPLAGIGFTLAGNPTFALRGTGRVALKNSYGGLVGASTWLPPWGVDGDLMYASSGRPFGAQARSLSTFVFAGIGEAAQDSGTVRPIRKNWSLGAGSVMPLGSRADLFGESRWRKPGSAKEIRIGLSLHVLGAAEPAPRRWGDR